MTIRQLEYFMAVAKTLNFTDAAEVMQVSQPALSRSIAALEAELSVTLLDRDHRSVSLTRSGQKLAAELPRLRKEMDSLLTQLKQTENGLIGRLNVGLICGQRRTESLQQTFRYFAQSLPLVEVTPRWMNEHALFDQLTEGKLDIICTTDAGIPQTAGVESVELETVPYCMLVSAEHRLAGSRFASLSDFEYDTFLVEETAAHNENAQLVTAQCAKAGFAPRLRRVSDIYARLLWVESGLGVSLFNTLCETEQAGGTSSIPLTDVEPAKLLLAWRRENQNPCVRIFTHMTCSYYGT